MSQWIQTFNMGGYGLYVWSAYGIFIFVLGFLTIRTYRKVKKTPQLLRTWYKRQPK